MQDKKTNPDKKPTASRGFWSEAWRRYRKRKLAMAALFFILFLTFVAVFSPAIAGTKPVICYYKGNLYFPCLGYFNSDWENPVFFKDQFRKRYVQNLKEKDPDSWAIWPLVYQDPYRRVQDDEWLGTAGNPWGNSGEPTLFGTSKQLEEIPDGNEQEDTGNENTTEEKKEKLAPANNILGTTITGVDVFAMMVHGTRIALLVGFVATGISALIGITVGAIAGYFGGWTDTLLSRAMEVVMCIPRLVLILAVLAVLETPNIWHIMAVLGVTSWTGIARLTRGEFLKLREMEYVAAARSLGAGPFRIMFRHILPNALAPILVPISFGIASAILIESGLSFLGFGTPPPNPSWGTLLAAGRANYQMWWLIVFPGAAIFLTVLAYNLIGEGIQEVTDPRLREAGK